MLVRRAVSFAGRALCQIGDKGYAREIQGRCAELKKQRYVFLLYVLAFAAAACVLPFLSSRPRYSVDNMRFASALALERDGEYVLTAYSKDGVLAEGRGVTVAEAFDAASGNCGGKLFYGTAEVLYVGSSAGGEDCLRELALYALSDSQIRLSVRTLLCPSRAADAYSEDAAESGTPLSAVIENVFAG